eukprot:5682234-Pyramimonas_sp.AAC.1
MRSQTLILTTLRSYATKLIQVLLEALAKCCTELRWVSLCPLGPLRSPFTALDHHVLMLALAQGIVERLMNCWNVAEKLGALLHRGFRHLRRQPEKALVERANLGRWALQEDPRDAVPCLRWVW